MVTVSVYNLSTVGCLSLTTLKRSHGINMNANVSRDQIACDNSAFVPDQQYVGQQGPNSPYPHAYPTHVQQEQQQYYPPQPQPMVHVQTPVVAQQAQVVDTKSVICGAVLIACGCLTFVMLLVFFIRYPVDLTDLTIGLQAGLCMTEGILLVAAGRTNLQVVYGCAILFGLFNIAISLYHIVSTCIAFASEDRIYYSDDLNATLGSFLAIWLITVLAAIVGLLFGCYAACCRGNNYNGQNSDGRVLVHMRQGT